MPPRHSSGKGSGDGAESKGNGVIWRQGKSIPRKGEPRKGSYTASSSGKSSVRYGKSKAREAGLANDQRIQHEAFSGQTDGFRRNAGSSTSSAGNSHTNWNQQYAGWAGLSSAAYMSYTELCSLMKRLQREDKELQDLWWRWCEATALGWRDPKRHSLESLRGFCRAVEMGTVPQASHALPSIESSWWHQVLVDRVKEGQRRSLEFKTQWWRYCDTSGNGIRDPGRHPPEFIQGFLLSDSNVLAEGGHFLTVSL
ncbi:unnamed protein product [Effrenium voratum]|uniref:Uncharacterized protein n=1 Tax=Effrenium voratum TaxID=2562239 RepID=A0AA36J952_9DINO|nr:unnamed protein product [Effrenium voratum]